MFAAHSASHDQFSTSGSIEVITGPKASLIFGAHLTKMRRMVASEKEFLTVQFTDGHTEVIVNRSATFPGELSHAK